MIKRAPIELPPEIASRFFEELRAFHAGRGRHQGAPALGVGAQPFSEISSVRYRSDSFPVDRSPFDRTHAAALIRANSEQGVTLRRER